MTKFDEFDEAEYYRTHPGAQSQSTNSPVNPTREASKVVPKVPGQSKYRNQRTPYNGRVYDTKGEAEKAQVLDYRIAIGEIDYWLYHVRFRLPGNCVYECDFMTFKYDTNVLAWDIEVIEKKMWRKASKNHKEGFFYTETAKIKMRLFTETYPLFKLIVEK